MDKIYKRIEVYLHKTFPKKTLVRCEFINERECEIYGINTMEIRVLQKEDKLLWQLVTLKN